MHSMWIELSSRVCKKIKKAGISPFNWEWTPYVGLTRCCPAVSSHAISNFLKHMKQHGCVHNDINHVEISLYQKRKRNFAKGAYNLRLSPPLLPKKTNVAAVHFLSSSASSSPGFLWNLLAWGSFAAGLSSEELPKASPVSGDFQM